APGGARPLPLADLGTGVAEATLSSAWSSTEILAPAPTGWRSGLEVTFPGSRRDDIWLREIRIDRERAWPSLRIVLGMAAAGLFLAVGILASGMAPREAWIVAGKALPFGGVRGGPPPPAPRPAAPPPAPLSPPRPPRGPPGP